MHFYSRVSSGFEAIFRYFKGAFLGGGVEIRYFLYAFWLVKLYSGFYQSNIKQRFFRKSQKNNR